MCSYLKFNQTTAHLPLFFWETVMTVLGRNIVRYFYLHTTFPFSNDISIQVLTHVNTCDHMHPGHDISIPVWHFHVCTTFLPVSDISMYDISTCIWYFHLCMIILHQSDCLCQSVFQNQPTSTTQYSCDVQAEGEDEGLHRLVSHPICEHKLWKGRRWTRGWVAPPGKTKAQWQAQWQRQRRGRGAPPANETRHHLKNVPKKKTNFISPKLRNITSHSS